MISEILNDLLDTWFTLVDFAMMAVYARVVPDWRFILRIFLLAGFVLGSGFLAATIAESRRHKMKFHFLLGLIAPYIYPLFIALRMKTVKEVLDVEEEFDPLADLSNSMSARFKDIQEEQKSKHDKRIKRLVPENNKEEQPETVEDTGQAEETPIEASEAEAVVEENPIEASETEAVVKEAVFAFNQRYFQEIAVDSSGAKAGPFKLVVMNGNEFKVSQIKNIQADMASFEVEVKEKVKNIRIKYDNIEIFEKI